MNTVTSQNGWAIIDREDTRLWGVPESNIAIPLRSGNAGFVLVHFMYNFHKTVEPLDIKNPGDDHGWAPRPISGTSVPSNHWSGTAVDLNSISHPYGVRGTFTKLKKLARLQWMLKYKYKGMIAWGGNWRTVTDEMHFEIVATQPEIRMLAQELRKTTAGRLIMRTN
jgi:hypothetical protein